MKKIIYILTAFLLIFAGSFSACKKEKQDNNTRIINPDNIPLINTKWKLAGIVDTKSGELRELEPRDCDECFTMLFITDTKAEGQAFWEKFVLDLNEIGKETFFYYWGLPKDEWDFLCALFDENTKTCSITSDQLKFINRVENYYLLFNRIEL